MDIDTIAFFSKMPAALPLYLTVREWICTEFNQVTVRVQKTQITFSNRYNFAFVSLPIRKMKNHPDVYIVLTFGLNRRMENPRIVESVEPYPGRWTHHMLIQSEDEVESEVKEWIREAYHFSMIK